MAEAGAGGAGAAAVGALAARGAASRPPRNPVAGVIAALIILFLGITAGLAAAQKTSGAGHTTKVDLTGCTGSGQSLDKNGTQVDSATAPSPKASPEHAFIVNYNGTVPYSGQSATVITNHHWHVSVFNIQVKSGGSKNGSHKQTSSGVEKVKDYLPVKVTGLFYVSGSIKGDGGACSGDVWVKLAGSPVGSVLWDAGLAFLVIGALLLLIGRPVFRGPGAARQYRRHPVTGLIGGLLFGIGFAALVISYGKAPFGVNTPLIQTIVLAVLGLLWGLFGPRRGRRSALI